MQKKQEDIALVWFKNNLRVHDNQVLNSAIANHSHVMAVYVFDDQYFEDLPYGFKKTEKFRARFLIETVTELKQALKNINIELFVYTGLSKTHIGSLIAAHHISHVYLEKEFTFEECQLVQSVKNSVPKETVFHEMYDQFLFHPEEVFNTFKTIPEVFTTFRKKLETVCNVRPSTLKQAATVLPTLVNNTQLPTLNDLGLDFFEHHKNSAFPYNGGETNALNHLDNYLFKTQNVTVYKKTRNGLIGPDYSSKLSPWLANGSLSARTIYHELKRFETEHVKNDSTYWLFFELVWRDYFKYIALKHGNQIFKIGGILNKGYLWNQDPTLIDQWIQGKTASPFVNANMIELKKTGWMSNRGRQNVASYFAKTLQLDWRIGAAYFESMLLDYDVHSNYGNWMYVSGVGNDPRDRVFNVSLQAERYDAHGRYQNLWLQETLF